MTSFLQLFAAIDPATFLLLYAVLAAAIFYWVRSPAFVGKIHPLRVPAGFDQDHVRLAYLRGGLYRAFISIVVDMFSRGALRSTHLGKIASSNTGGITVNPRDAAFYTTALTGIDGVPIRRAALNAPFRRLTAIWREKYHIQLYQLGFTVAPQPVPFLNQRKAHGLGIIVLVGVLRFWEAAVVSLRPTTFVAMIMAIACAAVLLAPAPRTTRAGKAYLDALAQKIRNDRSSYTAPAAVALLGTVALANTQFATLAGLQVGGLLIPGGSSGGATFGGCGSSNCGGGSSCGGGGCGGGCGG